MKSRSTRSGAARVRVSRTVVRVPLRRRCPSSRHGASIWRSACGPQRGLERRVRHERGGRRRSRARCGGCHGCDRALLRRSRRGPTAPGLATRSTRWRRPPAAGTSWRQDRRPGWLSRSKTRTGSSRSPEHQAAAFASISRSWRSRRFSRLSRRSSSRSALVKPSCERPSSRSAWPTQLRIAERKARTPEPAPPASGPIEPARPSAPGNRIRVDVSSASWTPFSQLIRCPPKRGKSRAPSTLRLRRGHEALMTRWRSRGGTGCGAAR